MPPDAVCMACQLPEHRCPGAATVCLGCSQPFPTGVVGYPLPDVEPALTWTAHGSPTPIADCYGHPLTFGTIVASHRTLTRHASCHQWSATLMYPSGYASEGENDLEPCACTYHDALIDELSSDRHHCRAWPGPWCNDCWRASCPCGYVFDDLSDAVLVPLMYTGGRRPMCSRCHAMGVPPHGRLAHETGDDVAPAASGARPL